MSLIFKLIKYRFQSPILKRNSFFEYTNLKINKIVLPLVFKIKKQYVVCIFIKVFSL